jgi:hypothetical protein
MTLQHFVVHAIAMGSCKLDPARSPRGNPATDETLPDSSCRTHTSKHLPRPSCLSARLVCSCGCLSHVIVHT